MVADREAAGAEAVAKEIDGLAVQYDAASESSVQSLIARATEANGPIYIFISNAGVPGGMGGPETPDEDMAGSVERQRDGPCVGLARADAARWSSGARVT